MIDEINNNKAKIIIANFDLENMANIAPYAKLKKLVRARNVIWITRDLSKTNAEEAADVSLLIIHFIKTCIMHLSK